MPRLGALARLAPRRVALVTLVVAAVIMGDSLLYNVLPSRVAAFGVSAGAVGLLLSVNRFVRLASNPFAAWLVQRFGLMVPLLGSVLLAVLTTALYGLGRGFGVLLVARALWGVCYSVLRLSGYLVVLEESRQVNRGRLMGFFNGGHRVGSMVAVLLGGLLFDLTRPSATFLVVAALGLLSLPAALALGGPSRAPGPKAFGSLGVPGSSPTAPSDLRQRAWGLLSGAKELEGERLRQVLVVSVVFCAFHLIMNGVLVATSGYYLSQRLGPGAALLGVIVGVATLNGILLATRWLAWVASPAFGHLGDRAGHPRLLAAALPPCVVTLLLLARPVPLWVAVSCFLIGFVASAAAMTALDTIIGGLAPVHRRAQVMSRYATWQDLGSALGPLLAYAAVEVTSLAPVYLGGAVLLAAAWALWLAAFHRALRGPWRSASASEWPES